MNVWADWVAPAVVLLGVALVWSGVLVARRWRVRAERVLAEARALAADGLAELQRCAATFVHLPGPVRHAAPALGEVPAPCLVGVHRWARRDVTNVRRAAESAPMLCSITWYCGDCPATRHEQNVAPPLSLVATPAAVTPTVAARTGIPGVQPAEPKPRRAVEGVRS
ncbi:hypothetical protein GCM10009613_60960 [Pseudonocardia kongjuensis]|uniref:Uncharacterized protein n=1 Tax=Pseudonocardia kongjuensis TaxID=102227 RepID=A0ABP4J2K5_9PSEU